MIVTSLLILSIVLNVIMVMLMVSFFAKWRRDIEDKIKILENWRKSQCEQRKVSQCTKSSEEE
jgi:hypothetical protein